MNMLLCSIGTYGVGESQIGKSTQRTWISTENMISKRSTIATIMYISLEHFVQQQMCISNSLAFKNLKTNFLGFDGEKEMKIK
jgi:hypothetical protein